MPGPLSINSVVKAALNGVVLAQKEYENWSQEWLWMAPEYFTTVSVARQIEKLTVQEFVTLEHSAKKAIKDAGATGRGKLHHSIRAGGKIDILLWWGDGTPRAPIEVKVQVSSFDKIKTDVERIEKVLHRNKQKSRIGFGAVVLYSSAKSTKQVTAKQKLISILQNIENNAKNKVSSTCNVKLHHSKIVVDQDSAWVSAVLILRPKNI